MVVEQQAIGQIIPQQETSGNYNTYDDNHLPPNIIPQQETSGNYNSGPRGPTA